MNVLTLRTEEGEDRRYGLGKNLDVNHHKLRLGLRSQKGRKYIILRRVVSTIEDKRERPKDHETWLPHLLSDIRRFT